jgi:hypothetical protein
VAGEAITDVLRVRGALKPLWWRITTSTMLAAVDYLKDYADLTGADFVRNPADIGIVSAFGDLRGPSFVPDRVHPLIWEFYEHTSRFHLTIVPDWRWWMKPAYPSTGQSSPNRSARPTPRSASRKSDGETSAGSTRSTSTTPATSTSGPGSGPTNQPANRSTLASTPCSNTPTAPTSASDSHSRAPTSPPPCSPPTTAATPSSSTREPSWPPPGHYLSTVYVEDGELKTDHRFYLSGILFLTLYYEIERKT